MDLNTTAKPNCDADGCTDNHCYFITFHTLVLLRNPAINARESKKMGVIFIAYR